MTSSLLLSELSALVQDSKRKFPELKSVSIEALSSSCQSLNSYEAAEKSLNELKSLSNISEHQLAAGDSASIGLFSERHSANSERDLRRRPTIVKPFLIACGTRNSKLAGNAIVCLQRLVVCNGLPREALKDVLGALRDAGSIGKTLNNLQLVSIS